MEDGIQQDPQSTHQIQSGQTWLLYRAGTDPGKTIKDTANIKARKTCYILKSSEHMLKRQYIKENFQWGDES